MAKKFDEIQIGDQLELTASHGSIIYGAGKDYDPDRVVRVAIVSHIWYDPVDDKEYVGLAYIRADGSHGKPTEKRTITGLARTGWRVAREDWVAKLKAIQEAEVGKIVSLFRRPSKR